MELTVYNTAGEATSKKVVLEDAVFAIKPNDHAVYLEIKQLLANRRQGTHKSKQRAEVAYSTKKIKRQKGTGGARAGSIKSPVFVGGGRVFGPTPRDYSHKLNKKIKRIARLSALSYKLSDQKIMVVEDFNFETPKTKDFIKINKSLVPDAKRILFVLPELNRNIYLSSRNIQKTMVTIAKDLNTYEIMKASDMVITESAVSVINEMYNSK